MELNYNSKLAKFYRWYYKTEKMPNSLCPYFWKLILPFITGLIILRLAAEPARFMQSNWEWETTNVISTHTLGLSYILGIGVVVGMLIFPFTIGNKSLYILHLLGFIGYIILVAGVIAWIVQIIIERREQGRCRRRNSKVEKEPNVIVEGVKRIFKKYCPIIKWENNETRENTETMD